MIKKALKEEHTSEDGALLRDTAVRGGVFL